MATYKKNLTLSLGPISTSVDLESAAPKVRSGLNRVCAAHVQKLQAITGAASEPTEKVVAVKIQTQYLCPGTGEDKEHTVAWGEWEMGLETPDGYKVVDVSTKPTAEPTGGLSLTPVPRKDLEASTLEGESLYYAKPSNEYAESTWAIFRRLVSSKTALITKGAIRKGTKEKLWRVTTFNNYLVLREIRFPENLKPSPDSVKAQVNKETYDLVTQFADKLMTEWDDFDSTDAMAARMEEWMSTGTDTEVQAAAVAPVVDLNESIREALKG